MSSSSRSRSRSSRSRQRRSWSPEREDDDPESGPDVHEYLDRCFDERYAEASDVESLYGCQSCVRVINLEEELELVMSNFPIGDVSDSGPPGPVGYLADGGSVGSEPINEPDCIGDDEGDAVRMSPTMTALVSALQPCSSAALAASALQLSSSSDSDSEVSVKQIHTGGDAAADHPLDSRTAAAPAACALSSSGSSSTSGCPGLAGSDLDSDDDSLQRRWKGGEDGGAARDVAREIPDGGVTNALGEEAPRLPGPEAPAAPQTPSDAGGRARSVDSNGVPRFRSGGGGQAWSLPAPPAWSSSVDWWARHVWDFFVPLWKASGGCRPERRVRTEHLCTGLGAELLATEVPR